MKVENRPFLIREFLCMKPLEFEDGVKERLILQGERLFVSIFFCCLCPGIHLRHSARMGLPQPQARPIPYNPYYRSRGRHPMADLRPTP